MVFSRFFIILRQFFFVNIFISSLYKMHNMDWSCVLACLLYLVSAVFFFLYLYEDCPVDNRQLKRRRDYLSVAAACLAGGVLLHMVGRHDRGGLGGGLRGLSGGLRSGGLNNNY